MASTSTNKEPLLLDRPLIAAVRLNSTSHGTATVDPNSTTQAALVVSTAGTDGCLIESLELQQRVANDDTAILLFLSTSDSFVATPDASGAVNAWFLRRAAFPASSPVGATLDVPLLPLLSPVPHAGNSSSGGGTVPGGSSGPEQFRGLRLPAGIHLWAAAAVASPVAGAPQLIVHGGWY
jgi:hypothetical protein